MSEDEFAAGADVAASAPRASEARNPSASPVEPPANAPEPAPAAAPASTSEPPPAPAPAPAPAPDGEGNPPAPPSSAPEEPTPPPSTERPTQPPPSDAPSPKAPVAESPAGTAASPSSNPDSSETKSAEASVSQCVKLNLTMLDFAGVPIAGLPVRILVNGAGRTVVTDSLGRCPPQEDLLPGSGLEIHVKKDDGTWAEKFAGTVAYSDMDMCGVSPHIKIPVETEPHKGPPQAAKTAPSPVSPEPLKPNPPPKEVPKSGGTVPCTKPEPRRNEHGNPIARVKEYFQDWAKRVGIPTFGLWTWEDFKGDPKKHTRPIECGPAETPASPAAKQAAPPAPKGASPHGPAPQPRSAAPLAPSERIGSLDQPPPPQLVRLLEHMEDVATWDFKAAPLAGKNTEQIKSQLEAKTLGEVTLKPGVSKGSCYKAVKIGLWRAEYVVGAGGGESPAKSAGDWLLSQNFRDVTQTLPDARWAWPGDVIVYRYPKDKAAANDAKAKEAHEKRMLDYQKKIEEYDKQKRAFDQAKQDHESAKKDWEKDNPKKPYPKKFTTKPPQAPKAPQVEDINYGHIDVRSYDSYLSDFKPASNSLPNALKFEVIGIYRKVSDPIPDLRLKAFLKVLREWECHEESNDARRYYILQQPIDGSRRFSDTSKHPQDGVRTSGTFAGAYQISVGTHRSNTSPESGIPADFSPATQDRIAVRIIEGRKALGAVRRGDIEGAVRLLKQEWTSLPGAEHARGGKSLSDLLRRHADFMKEYSAP